MANAAQRKQNRLTAKKLSSYAHICSECGERGFHYISLPESLDDILTGIQRNGFWTCAKFYDENGSRILQPTHLIKEAP